MFNHFRGKFYRGPVHRGQLGSRQDWRMLTGQKVDGRSSAMSSATDASEGTETATITLDFSVPHP